MIASFFEFTTAGPTVFEPALSTRVFDLGAVLRLKAQAFVDLNRRLSWLREFSTAERIARQSASEIAAEHVNNSLADIRKQCIALGLKFSIQFIDRMMKHVYQYPSKEAANDIHVLQTRIDDELKSKKFIAIPFAKVRYFENKELFGPAVNHAFPNAIEDIDEALRCFAVERWTACVFHLMRVMEIGVKTFGKHLRIREKLLNKPWGNILIAVDKKLNSIVPNTAKKKAIKVACAEAAAYLHHVKDAWRNDTMHPKNTYTEQQAKRLIVCVEDFMKKLSDLLST
jgi:hypothetical protein